MPILALPFPNLSAKASLFAPCFSNAKISLANLFFKSLTGANDFNPNSVAPSFDSVIAFLKCICDEASVLQTNLEPICTPSAPSANAANI